VLRAGNAGSNSAAGHVEAARLAVAQLPRSRCLACRRSPMWAVLVRLTRPGGGYLGDTGLQGSSRARAVCDTCLRRVEPLETGACDPRVPASRVTAADAAVTLQVSDGDKVLGPRRRFVVTRQLSGRSAAGA
jgi:hypothetical protein